jgi:flavodoxin
MADPVTTALVMGIVMGFGHRISEKVADRIADYLISRGLEITENNVRNAMEQLNII